MNHYHIILNIVIIVKYLIKMMKNMNKLNENEKIGCN